MVASLLNKKSTDYLLVFLLIAVSAMPYFCNSQINYIIVLVIAAFFFFKRSLIFDTRVLAVFGAFFSVELLHYYFLQPYDFSIILSTQFRLWLGYLVLALAGKRFPNYFVNIIYTFSIIGFLFFIPSLLYPPFFYFFKDHVCVYFDPPFAPKDGFYNIWPTNILYCFHDCVLAEKRNPGPFWEPGLYAVFLNLALAFNYIKEKKFITKKNIVLVLALLSTLSTGGYVAFFLLFFACYIIDFSWPKKVLYTLVIVPLLALVFFSMSFLNSKIDQNIKMAPTNTTSRFGSGWADIQDFSTSPLIGWGRGALRFGGRQYTFFTEDQHRNNGFTELLATYGVFIFLIYFFYYFKGFQSACNQSKFNNRFAGWFLLLTFTIGFSQTIFLRPFFLGLLFLSFTLPKKSDLPYENIY